MDIHARISTGILGAAFCAACLVPRTAVADGAASTRNIIFGGAAVAGTLLIINHNKKVHERYAEDARRQAELSSERDDAQAAYASERRAYEQEAALVSEYKREVAYQHSIVVQDERSIVQIKRRLAYDEQFGDAGFTRPISQRDVAPGRSVTVLAQVPPDAVSYGWGDF